MAKLQLDDGVNEAYEDVRNDTSETNWLYLEYDSENPKLVKVGGTGTDGLEGLKGNFKEDEKAFGYLRVITGDELSARAKFVLICWCGNKVKPLAKARFSTDKAFIKKVVRGFAVEIHATDESDIGEDEIVALVKKAGGANYGSSTS